MSTVGRRSSRIVALGISGARTPLPRVDPIPIAAASTVAGSRGADRGRASMIRGPPVRVMRGVPGGGGVLRSVIAGPVRHPCEHRTPLSAEYDLWSSPGEGRGWE